MKTLQNILSGKEDLLHFLWHLGVHLFHLSLKNLSLSRIDYEIYKMFRYTGTAIVDPCLLTFTSIYFVTFLTFCIFFSVRPLHHWLFSFNSIKKKIRSLSHFFYPFCYSLGHQ